MNINFKFSKFICAIITLIATPIHELGHLVGYQLSGIPAKFNFIYTESINVPVWGVYVFFITAFICILLFLKSMHRDYFFKCFKYAFIFYFLIMITFQIKIY